MYKQITFDKLIQWNKVVINLWMTKLLFLYPSFVTCILFGENHYAFSKIMPIYKIKLVFAQVITLS